MPDFVESLQGKDLGHLRIIAQLWEVELPEQEVHPAILYLKNELLDARRISNMITRLGDREITALDELIKNSGRMPWALFTRNHGELREMGVAKRDREHPHETPVSAVEALWYRGMLARAFFDTPAGPEEFAYIPDDLFVLFPGETSGNTQLMGRPASSPEYAQVYLANDRILDHTCTYLTAVRMGISPPDVFCTPAGEEFTAGIMKALLLAAGMIDEADNTQSEAVRLFLEARRGEAMMRLFQSWRLSTRFNELRFLPGLTFEGKWKNDPLRARNSIIDQICTISRDKWWNLGSFIAAVKQRNPDYQRPAGDYDSWFIKDLASGEYLRGFDHWERLDGRLIRFLITGPLHWLGVVDLACQQDQAEITACRLSRWSEALLNGQVPDGFILEKEPLAARSDARISARRLSPRKVRYQLARFCDLEKETPDEYIYRISPASLLRAKQQGLKVSQLVAILNHYAKAVPPSLLKALGRWEKQGIEARIEKMVILRVSTDEVLQALRKSRASRFLGEPLGPAAVAIRPGAVDKVLGALADLGYLGEVREGID